MPQHPSQSWTKKKWLILTLSLCVGISAMFLAGAYHYANVARHEADDIESLEMNPAKAGHDTIDQRVFSTDQMLSTLSLEITVLALLVGIATLGLAGMALFGYNELRAATFAKTEDDLATIITALSLNGSLSAATAAVLLQSVAPGRVFVVAPNTPEPRDMAQASENAPQSEQEEGSIAQDYPEENDGDSTK